MKVHSRPGRNLKPSDRLKLVKKGKDGAVVSEEILRVDELYSFDARLAKQVAREDFLAYEPNKHIARRYGIPIRNLDGWAYRGKNSWKKLRDKLEEAVIEEVLNQNIDALSSITAVAAEILVRNLTRMAAQAEKLTVEEASKVSTILTNVSKLLQLKKGEPTEIISEQITIQDVARQIKELDPYCDYEVEDVPETTH